MTTRQNRKGIALGQRQALSPEHVRTVRALPLSPRDRALFELGLDSMLRGADLLRQRIADVTDHQGNVRQTLAVVQGKVSGGQSKPVTCYLTDHARHALAAFLAAEPRDRSRYLFEGYKRKPLSTDAMRLLVKRWCSAAGMDATRVGNHTLRRSKASAIYAATHDLERVRQALGHAYLSSTQQYLNVEAEQVKRSCLSITFD